MLEQAAARSTAPRRALRAAIALTFREPQTDGALPHFWWEVRTEASARQSRTTGSTPRDDCVRSPAADGLPDCLEAVRAVGWRRSSRHARPPPGTAAVVGAG